MSLRLIFRFEHCPGASDFSKECTTVFSVTTCVNAGEAGAASPTPTSTRVSYTLCHSASAMLTVRGLATGARHFGPWASLNLLSGDLCRQRTPYSPTRFARTAAKRFRITADGRIRMKGMGMRHNTGLKRPRVTQARRRRRYVVGTNRIIKKLKKLILGQRG